MKRQILIICACAISYVAFAQTQVNKTTVAIPKDYKDGSIVSAKMNEDKQLEVVLALQKKKELKIMQFTFDQNAKKINEKEIQYDVYKTKNKELPAEGKQKLPRFVQVSKTAFWQELELEKGYILRTYYGRGYDYSEVINVEEKVKIKADDGRKIVPIASMHCDNSFISTKDFGFRPDGYYASGDLIVVNEVFPKLMVSEEKQPRVGQGSAGVPLDYCVVKVNAKTLDVEKKTLAPFDYLQVSEVCREISGKRIVLISRDFPGQKAKGAGLAGKYYNEGSYYRTVTIIDKNGDVESKFRFECIPNTEIVDAFDTESGNLYLFGQSGANMYVSQRSDALKDKGMVVIKINNQKAVYMANTLYPAIEAKIIKPSKEKKFLNISESWPHYISYGSLNVNSVLLFKGLFEMANNNLIAVYQQGGEGIATNLYYLQFDEKGNLVKQFTNALMEELTMNRKTPSGNDQSLKFIIRQGGNNVLYPIISEIKKEGRYYRIGKIDCNTGIISDFISYGLKSGDDKNEYYLDNEFPSLETDDNGLIMIGRTEDKDILWINKIKFD
jgi:hypothetical protein